MVMVGKFANVLRNTTNGRPYYGRISGVLLPSIWVNRGNAVLFSFRAFVEEYSLSLLYELNQG